MTVRTRILVLLLLVSAVFVGVLIAVREDQVEHFQKLQAKLEADWRISVDQFLLGQQRPAPQIVDTLAHDGEVVLACEFDDRRRLEAALADKTRKIRDNVHVVWVYAPDGRLLYSHALPTASVFLNEQALPGIDVAALVARNPEPYFFFEMPVEAPGRTTRRFVEVRGCPIKAKVGDSNDSPRHLGTLFAGRLFGEEELHEISLFHKDDSIRFASDKSAAAKEKADSLKFLQPLRDWNGRTIETLVVSNDLSEITKLEARNETHFKMLVAGALALFAVLFISLGRSIVRPLKLIIKGLHDENPASLAPLQKEKAEFGELARLIQTFFEQRTTLIREMFERIGAEKALRESEELLRHSQKMEAVGRLAGGVAHDFNNLLTAIIGYAELLKQRLGAESAERQAAELIRQAGEHAAGLTRQLLAFSRKQLLQPRVIDLNTVIANLHRLLQRIIGEHIEIVTSPDAANACVKADPGQIQQVIVNLGVNARDAMPRGGRLTIRTRGVEFQQPDPVTGLPPGEYVALEVTDTGEGMDAETKGRIFEPFFTTKGPGKGTGLGLATVYGIVKQSHGEIDVDSEMGRGTTFRIYLPCEHAPVDPAETAPQLAQRSARAEMILVVEDEEIVRDLVCEVLRGHGYRVLGTDRGSEALRLLGEEAREVDLLISDVVMPEMNGAAVAQRARAIAPQIRVLFVSGYSENDMADQGLEALSFQVLQKPFTPAVLARKVREILDGPVFSPTGDEKAIS